MLITSDLIWCHRDMSKLYLLFLTFTVLSNYDLIFSNWWNRKMFLQLGLNQWPPPLYKGALTDWAMKDTALSQSKLHLYVSSIWILYSTEHMTTTTRMKYYTLKFKSGLWRHVLLRRVCFDVIRTWRNFISYNKRRRNLSKYLH